MKKILFFLIVNYSLIFSQGIYFVKPEAGKTYYSGSAGSCPIEYEMIAANWLYVGSWYAQLTYPDWSNSGWQSGRTGGWWVTKAGTYQIKGKAWARNWLLGTDWTWYYRPPFSFYVVDNYAPSAPQNLTVSAIGGQGVSYPKLEWNLNNEDDVEEASQGYFIERRLDVFGNGNWSAWTELGNVSGLTNTYIDYTIIDAGNGPKKAQYRIRAKDLNNNYSNYSSSVEINYGTSQQKIVPTITPNVQESYSLNQNFPNPFNPITSITYHIKIKGLVTLIIYDILGKEVAILVNETQEPGTYTKLFNAVDLPSGIYIYTLRVNEFIQNKRMIVLK